MASRNSMPVTTEDRPVRPPSLIPVEDSTKVVTVEVPRQAPAQVAMASAIRARSPPGRLPSSSSIPALPAVPISVPTVSNMSTDQEGYNSRDKGQHAHGKQVKIKLEEGV